MYLRANKRIKDGKEHRYWSVEESRRLRSGRVVQRRVLYLGEINDSQQAAWRKTLEVFDEVEQRAASLSLFPEDRALPADALGWRAGEVEGDGVAAAAGVWQLLAGVRAVAAVGVERVLGRAAGQGAGGSAVGEGAGVAGGEPAGGAGQRVPFAPARV